MHWHSIYLRPPDAQFYTLLGAGESMGGGPTRGTGNSNTAYTHMPMHRKFQLLYVTLACTAAARPLQWRQRLWWFMVAVAVAAWQLTSVSPAPPWLRRVSDLFPYGLFPLKPKANVSQPIVEFWHSLTTRRWVETARAFIVELLDSIRRLLYNCFGDIMSIWSVPEKREAGAAGWSHSRAT